MSLVNDENLRGRQGELLTTTHTLTNLGNGADTFDLSSVFSGDHTPSLSIYIDSDASGDLSAGDALIIDTDGDGAPDSGVLIPGQPLILLFAYQIAAGNGSDPSGTAIITTTAISSAVPFLADSVTDTVEVDLDVTLLVLKSVNTLEDPINLTVNPKAIPGAVMLYSVQVSNQGGGAADANSVWVTDDLPQAGDLFVGDINGPGSGPVLFVDGSPPSGVSYTFLGLADATDSLSFSSDGGLTFNYTPVPDAAGFDGNVTHMRITPSGSLAGTTAAGSPAFELRYRLRVD